MAAQSAPHGERRASTRRRSICTICTEQTEAVFAFFANWQNELVTNTSARHAFATAQGFCSVHTWQFAQIASPQSLSVGYLPLIEASIENLERLPGEAPAPLAAVEGCAACQVIRNTGAAAISQCVATLAAEGRDDVEPGDGLCLPHLHAVLASDPAGSSCTG